MGVKAELWHQRSPFGGMKSALFNTDLTGSSASCMQLSAPPASRMCDGSHMQSNPVQIPQKKYSLYSVKVPLSKAFNPRLLKGNCYSDC